MLRRHDAAVILQAALLMLVVGCASNSIEKPSEAEQRLRKLHELYESAEAKLGRPPKSQEELLRTIPNVSEEIFVSPNDQQAFVVVWGTSCTPMGYEVMAGSKPPTANDPAPILAYERSASNGKRAVVYLFGETKQLDEKNFRSAWFPPGHTPE
ncbi:MAG: hypothetical protein KatS3mg105_4176 [Gemmatales bacterium]|nr:MAG: hypothetical protein KatS3mg105_4176 [Gemmatales bacterium]